MTTLHIPDKRLEYECIKGLKEWVGTKIVFDLEEKAGTTVVSFEQEGWEELTELFDMCKTDWLFYLNSLKAFAKQEMERLTKDKSTLTNTIRLSFDQHPCSFF